MDWLKKNNVIIYNMLLLYIYIICYNIEVKFRTIIHIFIELETNRSRSVSNF